MTDDQQRARAQFEAWCNGRYNLATRQDSLGDGVYVDRWVQGAWVGFRAALRAAPEGTQEPVCFIPARDAELLRNREFSLVSMHSRWERPSGDPDWVGVYLAARPQGVKDV